MEVTSTNHIILLPNTADITINDLPIDSGDYVGVFYLGQDEEYHCAGKLLWTGVTTTMTVYGAEPNEFNGWLLLRNLFGYLKASINEVQWL